jgi:HPt (histidine-containing phosphotransfer) domain-containing protein
MRYRIGSAVMCCRLSHTLKNSRAWATLQDRVDALSLGDAALGVDIMRLLVDTNRTTLAAMKSAQRKTAWDELRCAVHCLNGSLRMLGASCAARDTERLEQAAKAKDVVSIDALMPVVGELIDELNEALECLLERLPVC